MNPLQDLPMGFGMALAQNQRSAAAFYAMSLTQQQEILQKTHKVTTKQEMQTLVNALANPENSLPQTM